MGMRRWSFGAAEMLVSVPDEWIRNLRTLGGLLPSRVRGSSDPLDHSHADDPEVESDGTPDGQRLARRVHGLGWYHSIDLPHGVVTPGGFDHRPYLSHYPIPARLDGLRVLDVATFDGFWAFEFERRGAAEVVAIDVANMSACDLPPSERARATPEALARDMGNRFRLCHEVLGSKVRREIVSVYDLSPERLGTFDLVFAGDVLLHLMNPMKALQNICSVTAGSALLVDVFNPVLPGKLISYESGAVNCTWWMMSLGGFESMIADAGFSRVTLRNQFKLGYRGEAPSIWRAAFEAFPDRSATALGI